MAKAPRFPSKSPIVLSGPIFKPEDAQELAESTFPLSADDGAATCARLLNEIFRDALQWAGHDEQVPSPRDLDRFYDGVIRNARALADALDIPNSPELMVGGRALGQNGSYLRALVEPDSIEWIGRILNSGQVDRQQEALAVIAEIATAALSAEQRAVIEHDGATERAVGLAAIRALLPIAPHVLNILIGLAELSRDVPVTLPPKTNFERSFLRELFRGLVAVHYAAFRRPPAIEDNKHQPNGRSVVWVEAILRMAAERIERLVVINQLHPDHNARDVVLLFKTAADLSRSAIAARLADARKAADADALYEAWPRLDAKLTPPL
jgi:hypothetical protein